MHDAFPFYFAKHFFRNVEAEDVDVNVDVNVDVDEEDDDNDDTAHGSNAAISSLFTNFGYERW